MTNELAHHGILGMKWGIRRTPEQLGHKNKTSKNTKPQKSEKVNADHARARSKNVKKMSDQELREAINRLMMEKQYSNLNPGSLARGKKATMAIIGTIGTIATVGNSIVQIHNTGKTLSSWRVARNVRDTISNWIEN